jgi:hypothetical protein
MATKTQKHNDKVLRKFISRGIAAQKAVDEKIEEHWSSPNGCHADCPACEQDAQKIGNGMITKMKAGKKKAQHVGQYLKEASAAYPDRYVENYFDVKTGKARTRPIANGDTLALFIGHEILGVYDSKATDEANRSEIARALNTAAGQLMKVADVIDQGGL